MTDQTPAYWVVIYTADDWTDAVSGDRRPLISAPVWAKTKQEASHRIVNARQGRDALNTVGPFTDQTEAESYRRTWARDQGKRTIATLMDETASVIHTNSLHDRPGRTPAQNAALPSVVNLYQAFNIVAGGAGPDDTRGNRDGINSADLVRTFNAFLNQGSALKWSQAPERTHPEIVNALHACASALRDAAGGSELSALLVGDMFTGPRMLVHVGDVVQHTGMVSNLIVTSRHEDRGFWLTPESGGEPFVWDDYEMPGNEGSPFTLVSCPHLDATAEPAAGDPADDEEIETSPFPVACSQIHEHDEVACAPEPLVSDAGTAETVWSVTAESFDGADVPAETFVRISDMNALIIAHRAAGASVEVSWPFGSDGTESPTYVHFYVGDSGVVTFRRANPGEGSVDATEAQS